MIARFKAAIGRFWPVLRLRWVLFGTLLFVAALPGVAAFGLRVYENALVRRTEAELTAQGAALAASAALLWPGNAAATGPDLPDDPEPKFDSAASFSREATWQGPEYTDISTTIDLRSSPILPERPAAMTAAGPPDQVAQAVAARLAPAIAETKQATLASILLLDRSGVLLNGRDRGLSLAQLPEVSRALGGKPVTVLRHNDSYAEDSPLDWVSRATSIRLHQARPILVAGQPVGVILVSRSPRAVFRGMWEDRGKIAAGAAAIFALLVVLTGILARAIVRPIEHLSRAARALAQGEHAAPPRPTLQVREIRSLFDDFAAMSDSIARRSRYLRDFAAALSHEFKTPLAGIRGGIELLQDHGATMDPAERTRFLANMAVDSERLSRLVSRLMELAQADMGRADPAARAELAPVLARVADSLRGAGFAVTIDLPPRLPALAIDPAALEAVLVTLGENARQAGASNLTITARREEGMIRLRLADNGPGIPAGDREKVFDPFFTSKRETGGTGLGLPIAQALLQGSQGWLELETAASGACFVLAVPEAG